jgi:hypothetical protein
MNGILGVIVFVGVTLPLMMLAWPLIVAGWIILGIAGVLGLIGAIIMVWKEK